MGVNWTNVVGAYLCVRPPRPGRHMGLPLQRAFFFVATLLSVALLATACGEDEPPVPAAATEPTPTPTAAPEPAVVQTASPAPLPTEDSLSATEPGKIAFASDKDGDRQIHVMNADGSNETRLTSGPGVSGDPSWSPDGSEIVFSTDRDGNEEIYVMDADGSNPTRLTNSPADENQPAWSPDGTRITYVSRVGEGNWDIWVMDADGTNRVRLTFNLNREEAPTWSPDGARIVYVVPTGGIADIFVMNADGSDQVNLTHQVDRERRPAWSPDGARIAFSSPRIGGNNFDVWVMNTDGTEPIRLTTTALAEGGAAWSPDGARIAYVARVERGSMDIYVMNADGTDPTRITSTGARVGPLAWSSGSVPKPVVPTTAASGEGAAGPPAASAVTLQLVGTALTEPEESPLAGVHVHGNYAFVGSQSISYMPPETFKTGIRILDISDPANPALVGRIPLRSFEYGSGVRSGDHVPHSHGDAVATRIDSAAFRGDIAIVLQGVPDTFSVPDYPMPFGIWDVTDPSDPQFLGPLSLGNHFFADDLGDKPNDFKAVKGHYFYAVYSTGDPEQHEKDHHVAIVDLSDPRDPAVVGRWEDTKQVHLRGLSVNDAGTRVYVIGGFGKELLLYVLDVQDPANPVELGRFVWPFPFAGSFSPGRPVANADDTVLIFADGSWERGRRSSLHILDISDLSSIREISRVEFLGRSHARDLAFKGSLVYSTWLGGGVQAVDVSDPANPVKVGGFSSPNRQARDISDVALYGDYAVATTVWGPGLYILRLAAPQSTETATASAIPTSTPTPGPSKISQPTPTPVPDERPSPVIASISVGNDPQSVRVNHSTNLVYVANQRDDTVSVIDGASNAVIATISVGDQPLAIGVNSTTGRVYVTNRGDATVSVIDGASNAVIATVPVGDQPFFVGVNPITDRVYITNRKVRPATDGTVSVIDGTSNVVIATVPVGAAPQQVGVNPTTNRVYVTNYQDGTVSVIDGASNTVIATVPVGDGPIGVGVDATANRVYVSNIAGSQRVSVIDGTSNAVISTISVGETPVVVEVNPSSNRVYVANHGDGTLSVLDEATNAVIATVRVGSRDSNVWVAVGPGGDRVYVSKADDAAIYIIEDTLILPGP